MDDQKITNWIKKENPENISDIYEQFPKAAKAVLDYLAYQHKPELLEKNIDNTEKQTTEVEEQSSPKYTPQKKQKFIDQVLEYVYLHPQISPKELFKVFPDKETNTLRAYRVTAGKNMKERASELKELKEQLTDSPIDQGIKKIMELTGETASADVKTSVPKKSKFKLGDLEKIANPSPSPKTPEPLNNAPKPQVLESPSNDLDDYIGITNGRLKAMQEKIEQLEKKIEKLEQKKQSPANISEKVIDKLIETKISQFLTKKLSEMATKMLEKFIAQALKKININIGLGNGSD